MQSYTQPFEAEAHDSPLLFTSKDTVQRKRRAQAVCTVLLRLPVSATLPHLASLPFKFLLKSLFPKTGLIRFSELRFNSLPSIQFLHGRKSLSIKGDKDISSPTDTPFWGPRCSSTCSPGNRKQQVPLLVGHTVRGVGKVKPWFCVARASSETSSCISCQEVAGPFCFCLSACSRSLTCCVTPGPFLCPAACCRC